MRTSGRRRLDAILLGVGAAATGGVAAVGGLLGETERVTGMWVGVELREDSSGEIHEVIDYDFGIALEKHGIFRTIPGLTTQSPVSVQSASAPDGLAGKSPHVFDDGEHGIELKIGDPNVTVTGRHRYLIDYGLPSGVLVENDRLEWDAVGQEWTVTVAQSDVHVVAPWDLEAVECYVGPRGSTDPCDEVEQVEPGHLVVHHGSLDSGNGLSVFADRGAPLTGAAPTLPAPPASAPPDPGAGLAMPAAVAAIAGLGASASASTFVRRRGRERVGTGGVADAAWAGKGDGPTTVVLLDHEELTKMATTEFAPPEGLTAAMGGVVLTETVQPEHKVAWLIEAAIEGAVELVEEGRKKVRLVRTAPGSDAVRSVLDTAFGGRAEVTLGKYDPKFAKAWGKVEKQLSGWQRRSGLWDQDAERRRTVVRGLGVAGAILGVVVVALGGAAAARWGEAWLPLPVAGALLLGAGFAAALRGWELRVRTARGSGMWLRVESFRRFLHSSEAFHAEEAAKRGVLREYTAWAVAVGEIDRWERAVSASSAIPEDAGLGYVHMAPHLSSATSSASTAPSSSGSGGGGGSSGGGGGGGGGGSW